MDKEIRSDSKLKGAALKEEQHDELWELRYPSGEAERLSLEAIAATEVPRICGVTCSVSTLHSYYRWARQKRRTDAARERAEQAKRDLLERVPDADTEDLERIGQMVFTSETIEEGNIKAFTALLRESNRRRKLEIDERKMSLLEEQAKKAEQAEAVTKDGKLSSDEKQLRLKQIFGIG